MEISIRSWGKGMFKLPHGIRIVIRAATYGPWTPIRSMVYKFTPEGKKLLEIAVGDVPG